MTTARATAIGFLHAADHATDHEVSLTEVTALPATGTVNRRLHALFRVSLLLVAGLFFITGFVVLSSPLAVPFTVTMWICAAATLALGIKADQQSERPAATMNRA